MSALNERVSQQSLTTDPSSGAVLWRVEGSLLRLSSVRVVAFFTWNAQSFSGRWMRRARELGWPNTYCFTKSLGEALLARRAADLPAAVVRPSITETSTHQPFPGWNEGVSTSGPLSYLLGTYFRQLPSNERKCLDLIPVDLVSRGMTLIAAALVARRHEKLIELYEPFILHNEHVFEAQNVEALSAALPPEEKEAFGYDPHTIDWWEYWINIHVPALRKWTYPLIEGRPLETRPARRLRLDPSSETNTEN